MRSVVRRLRCRQQSCSLIFCTAAAVFLTGTFGARVFAVDAVLDVSKTGQAKTKADLKPYSVELSRSVKFEMLPILGGRFVMGSPSSEAKRKTDEGPQHEVKVDPFWMGKCEVTWDEYDIWSYALDIKRRAATNVVATQHDRLADAIARPTAPYTDMTFGMGKEGFPAICMTQYAAKTYCEWLSAKTGHYYRLPTEAEWEYACRGGTTTAYSFGDDRAKLDECAWHFDNADDKYQKVGQKKPNPWGLHDMHGNVAEWCLDQYIPNYYEQFKGRIAHNPLAVATQLYPQVVRGGSWDDEPELLRSAARRGSEEDWKQQDPQIPQSIWYFTDALFVGFRVVRPLNVPTADERAKLWDAGIDK